MIDQFGTEHLAASRVLRGDVVRAPRGAKPAHAVRQAGGREPDLCITEAFAGLSQYVGGGNAEVVETNHGVAAGEGTVETVHGADDFDAGPVHIGQEHGGVT